LKNITKIEKQKIQPRTEKKVNFSQMEYLQIMRTKLGGAMPSSDQINDGFFPVLEIENNSFFPCTKKKSKKVRSSSLYSKIENKNSF
jgi:hypothetical protein